VSNYLDLFGVPISGTKEKSKPLPPMANEKCLESKEMAAPEALSYFEAFPLRRCEVFRFKNAALIWY
jgi:hypothetical protein